MRGSGNLDDKRIAEWLKTKRADNIIGRVLFDGPNNYGDDVNRVKQLQGGKWVVMHPKDMALPGSRLLM